MSKGFITSSKFAAGFRREATKYPPKLGGHELVSMLGCVYSWKKLSKI